MTAVTILPVRRDGWTVDAAVVLRFRLADLLP